MREMPRITFINFCGTNFWARAPRYMPMNPPRPKRIPKGQSGIGEMPLVAWITLKNSAPANDVMNVPMSVAPAMV